MSKYEDFIRLCCNRKFNPHRIHALEPYEYQSQKMVVGFCPHCGNMIVEVYKLDYSGKVSSKTFRKEKARKFLENISPHIIGDYYGNIKYGTKSNMGFRYGDNKEIHDHRGKVVEIRRYAVDFNGTRELLKTIKV